MVCLASLQTGLSVAIALFPRVDSLQTEPRQFAVGQMKDYSFGHFVKQFGRPYMEGTQEWNKREQLFLESLQKMVTFNSVFPRTNIT